MKGLIFLFLLGVASACNDRNAIENKSIGLPIIDTSSPGTIITDSAGASDMNVDTSGMSKAR